MKIQAYLILLAILIPAGCKSLFNKGMKEHETMEYRGEDNSKNSLDWNGTYQGIMPCADCEGIQTEIVLNPDLTYRKAVRYLGKSDEVFTSHGPFKWNPAGNSISLLGEDGPGGQDMFLVGENKLIKLDNKGDRIKSSFSEMYVLKKPGTDPGITEKFWKLIELRGREIILSEGQQPEPHFILKAAENRIVGNGGCNIFNGTYELSEGNRVKFSKMASTRMACFNVDYENDFLKVFEGADNYSIIEDTLTLNSGEMEHLARFKAVFFSGK